MAMVDETPDYLKEMELNEDLKQLIASLPTTQGWVASNYHQFQGFWLTTPLLKGILACQLNFQPHPTDVFLVTTPKSGTTWLKAIMFALVNRSEFPNPKKHPLLSNNPHVLVPFLEKQYINESHPNFNQSQSVRLISTHLPFSSLPRSVIDSNCKLVYLCRNPKDTFVSLWHFTNKLRPCEKGCNSIEETFDKFCNGVSLYGPFWDHVLEYWNQSLENPKRVLFLKYEDLQSCPKVQVKKLCEFLGCPFTAEEESNGLVDEILDLCSFSNLSSLEVNKTGKLPSGEENSAFFRRGTVGDSMNYLTEEMAEKMDQITQEKLHGSGLSFP